MRSSSGSEQLLVFAAFWALSLSTLVLRREEALDRTPTDWWLDGSGLLIKGVLVPALQLSLPYLLLPDSWHGAIRLPPWAAFCLNFIAVDYLYYWNHRLLHVRGLWPVHEAHHSARRMDVFITSRNIPWAPVLIVYLWVNGLTLFLLEDPRPFAWGMALTAALDLWRHSGFSLKTAHGFLAPLLITPN